MNRNYLLLTCLFFLSLTGFSQQVDSLEKAVSSRPVFQSWNHLSLYGNAESVHGGIQTVNGIAWSHFFAGIGAGIDGHRIRSIPLFADFRALWPLRRDAVFAYADLGYHFPWPTGTEQLWNGWGADHDLSGGFYTDLGLGYLRPLGKRNALSFSFGYSRKEMRDKQTPIWVCPGGCSTETGNLVYNYKFNRYVFKAGWRFGKRAKGSGGRLN